MSRVQSPVTAIGIQRRLQAMRRAAVTDILQARKCGRQVYRTMAAVLKRLPACREVIDPAPRLPEALACFGGAK
ncbi:hypothetical protein [Arenimonas alkanexedens]